MKYVILTQRIKVWIGILSSIVIISIVAGIGFYIYVTSQSRILLLQKNETLLSKQLQEEKEALLKLQREDQYIINQNLKKQIDQLEQTYKQSVKSYEQIVDLRDQKVNTKNLDSLLAQVIRFLSEKNYSSASAQLTQINKEIDVEKQKLISSFTIPTNVPMKNTTPASGFARQQVQTDIGTFLVDIVSADLNSTRVIVDTASDGDCRDNCPVLSLGEYAGRSGAYAGINGSYFCPASYPSCSGKANSFDTLIMNKNKTYFNSDNNVYSTVPAVIFSGNSARFVGQSLEWGRDTGVDAVLANQPLLVAGGNVIFGGNSDPKQGGKGSRSFVGSSGNMVYIGVVHNATVAEVARVLHTMGIQNALNLDSGGSTALWVGGYKVGPGRAIPNALLFVRK